MSIAILILLIMFMVMMIIHVPIAFVLAGVTVIAAFALGYDQVLVTVAADMASGPESFTLLAIPFFILAGELLGAGGQARRLIDFASSIVGRFPGGLAWVNTLTCMLFGAISGSAAAAVSSIGGTLIPEMNRKGYDRDFNIALTTTSATTGLLIPPSNVMIVYAVAMGSVSIDKLFLAGVMPGLLVGSMIMVLCYFISRKKGIGRMEKVSAKVAAKRGAAALPSLLLVIVVLGGIIGGIFTATEASAIAAVWAFLLAVVFYRELKMRDMKDILYRSVKTTAVVLLLVAASRAMSQLLTSEQIPQQFSAALMALSDNPVVIILAINVLLLIVGIFMDMTPAVLIFTPILAPVTMALGMDPIHFGIIMITNLCIGLCTPPVGTCLFVGCSVGKGNIAKVSRAMIPFYIAMIIALMLISYFPAISLWLPSFLD